MNRKMEELVRNAIHEYEDMERMSNFGKLIFGLKIMVLFLVSFVVQPKKMFNTMKYR